MSVSLVWLRDDLRIADNPALTAALASADSVAVVYVLDEVSSEARPLGRASKWWLHQSLTSLAADISKLGGHLILRSGSARDVIPSLVSELGATSVHWAKRFGATRNIDADLKSSLPNAQSHHGSLLHEPWSLVSGAGTPFKVFTPFWKTYLANNVPRSPFPAPKAIPGVAAPSESLESWNLEPEIPWDAGLNESWTPGETGANARLNDFLKRGLALYHRRDEPAVPATSRLSPHLRFGEISPYQIWHAVEAVTDAAARKNAAKFLSEVGWREFSFHQLFHNPDIHTRNLRSDFDSFPWQPPNPQLLRAWRRGETGVSLVDAGMRELWATGTMHNRVRMVTASFLIKNLGIDWRIGEQWFWDTLVDADEASNPASWQWVAGSGYDAAPYFRVFNPELQAAKFDADAEYRLEWVPEFGTPDYPDPIVDLAESRNRALAAYSAMKDELQP
jgi:deoxyribodipyrimidine photo-lyase